MMTDDNGQQKAYHPIRSPEAFGSEELKREEPLMGKHATSLELFSSLGTNKQSKKHNNFKDVAKTFPDH